MDNKQRLLDLISKRKEMCSKSLNYESVYEWLEELHYLFSQINISSSIVLKTLIAIEQSLSLVMTIVCCEEDYFGQSQINCFWKYEVEKLRDN